MRKRSLLELILHLLDASLGAAFVACLIVAADADAADRLVADLDRIAAAERNDIGKLPLAKDILPGLGRIAPFERRTAERPGGVGLAPGELDAVRGGAVGRN